MNTNTFSKSLIAATVLRSDVEAIKLLRLMREGEDLALDSPEDEFQALLDKGELKKAETYLRSDFRSRAVGLTKEAMKKKLVIAGALELLQKDDKFKDLDSSTSLYKPNMTAEELAGAYTAMKAYLEKHEVQAKVAYKEQQGYLASLWWTPLISAWSTDEAMAVYRLLVARRIVEWVDLKLDLRMKNQELNDLFWIVFQKQSRKGAEKSDYENVEVWEEGNEKKWNKIKELEEDNLIQVQRINEAALTKFWWRKEFQEVWKIKTDSIVSDWERYESMRQKIALQGSAKKQFWTKLLLTNWIRANHVKNDEGVEYSRGDLKKMDLAKLQNIVIKQKITHYVEMKRVSGESEELFKRRKVEAKTRIEDMMKELSKDAKEELKKFWQEREELKKQQLIQGIIDIAVKRQGFKGKKKTAYREKRRSELQKFSLEELELISEIREITSKWELEGKTSGELKKILQKEELIESFLVLEAKWKLKMFELEFQKLQTHQPRYKNLEEEIEKLTKASSFGSSLDKIDGRSIKCNEANFQMWKIRQRPGLEKLSLVELELKMQVSKMVDSEGNKLYGKKQVDKKLLRAKFSNVLVLHTNTETGMINCKDLRMAMDEKKPVEEY